MSLQELSLPAKTVKSLHFTQHYASSLSKGIFPIPTFRCNDLKVKGQKDQTCTQSHFQISVEVEFFSDINFSISMIYSFNSLALLQMRNAPTDKLLRHNVMLYVTLPCCGRQMGAQEIWVVQHNLLPARNVCKMTESSNMNDPLFQQRIDFNIIILIHFDCSCVSIGLCFD